MKHIGLMTNAPPQKGTFYNHPFLRLMKYYYFMIHYLNASNLIRGLGKKFGLKVKFKSSLFPYGKSLSYREEQTNRINNGH